MYGLLDRLSDKASATIAQHMIRKIDPKKQTNNPYMEGDDNAPAWWPKPWGPVSKYSVRHIAPTDQKKRGLSPGVSAARLRLSLTAK